MQIKEFEADSLKECLQHVRNEMGPEAVILETRKLRKGGLLGVGARDSVTIVAATGISVDPEPGTEQTNIEPGHRNSSSGRQSQGIAQSASEVTSSEPLPLRSGSARLAVARGIYGKTRAAMAPGRPAASSELPVDSQDLPETMTPRNTRGESRGLLTEIPGPSTISPNGEDDISRDNTNPAPPLHDDSRISYVERAIAEIRDRLTALQHEQRSTSDRTVSAVVSAVAPALKAVQAAGFAEEPEELKPRFPDIEASLRRSGLSEPAVQDLIDSLPDLSAWSDAAQQPLALSALKDIIARRIFCSGPIRITPGSLKVVALVGATGVGKTTTIAKLAAHFALMQAKKVALITVDTYRIAAVEQLKVYGRIIGIPVRVAYSTAEVPGIVEEYADYDLVLIDTAGRSQQHAAQVEELKELLAAVPCESHLVVAASTKESDMLEAVQRFSAARVDRIIFSKLDETSTCGSLFQVADQTGLPISYFTTGQKVPEDIEAAEPSRLAGWILDSALPTAQPLAA